MRSEKRVAGKIIFLVFVSAFFSIFFSSFVLAASENMNFEDYKIVNYQNILIASEKISYCSWKPDILDDNYKICNLNVIIWNKRDTPVSIDMLKDKFDFEITKAIRDELNLYYSVDWEIYEENRLNSTDENPAFYSVSKIRFDNWNELDNLTKIIPPDTIIGIKINFEFLKYDDAFWNFTYTPLNMLLDPNISACGALNTANSVYTLNQSVNTTTTCFTIGANNVTLDLNGFYVTGYASGTNAYHGVDINGYNYTTIKNGKISEFGIGIYTPSSKNLNFTNLTINTGYGSAYFGTSSVYGIYFTGINSYFSNLTIDRLRNSGSYSTLYGIYLLNSNNNILTGSIANNTGYGNGGVGIYLSNSNNNTLMGNTANDNNDLTGYGLYGQGFGIYLSSSNNNTLIGNTASYNKGYGTMGYGIYLSNSNNNTLTGNTANSNGPGSSGGFGIYLSNSSNSRLTGCTTNSSGYGIFLILNSNNNLINLTFSRNNSYGIYFSNSSNTEIIDGNVSKNQNDVYLTSTSINNTFLNMTYSSESVASGCQLIRKWWYRAYVNDTSGNNISNANVTAYNVSGGYQFNLTTDSIGYTPLNSIIDYINNAGTKSYYSLYNISARYLSANITHTFNAGLGNNYKDVFTLSIPPNSCNYVSGNWIVNCSDNCTISFPFSVDGNLTFAGAGAIILNSTLTFTNPGSFISRNYNCKLQVKSGGRYRF